MLIHEQSRPGRRATGQAPKAAPALEGLPEQFRRKSPPRLPEVSEMQAVRHYTRLSQKNFSIDTQFYPLGSCTMKYNPRACNSLAMLPGLLARHPHAPDSHSQGFLACMWELQEMLRDLTDRTFNCITVDGDTSTSDTLLLAATGAAGVNVEGNGDFEAGFRQCIGRFKAFFGETV